MALSSFIANCFKYLRVSKMKPICIPQIFYADSEFINHSTQKTSFIGFFFIWNFKILKLLAFLSHRDYAQNAYFWKTLMWSMSAEVCGKKYAIPLTFIPSPHPSPPRTRDFLPTTPAPPSANCPGPMMSGLSDHVTSWANGCGAPVAQQRQSVLQKK